jgi:putative ABC transport system permease protein
VLNDLRLAARALRRTPGFAIVAVLTIALGVAATTTVFSVAYGVLFRPLPFGDPDRIVLIEGWNEQVPGRPVRATYAPADLAYWRDRPHTLDAIAFTRFESMSLTTSAGSDAVLANVVTPEFFTVVRGTLAMGRVFSTADADAPFAIITAHLWRRVFNRSADAVGARLLLNSRAYTVVGVLDDSFRVYEPRVDVWLTTGFSRASGFSPVARLKPGVTLQQAQADADTISRALARDRPAQYEKVHATIVRLNARLIGEVRPALLVLLAAVGLVLVVACANVANLLLARNASRVRELAIRQSLGASSGQLARYSLAEATLVASAGTGAGALLARWLTALLVDAEPKGLPKLDAIRVDTPVLLFAFVMSALTALAIGLAQAAQTANAGDALRASAGTTGAPGAQRIRATLVVMELAVSMVLLVGASLLGRSFVKLVSTDIGVATDHVAQALIAFSLERTVTPEQRAVLANRIVERLETLPGVQAAGLSASLPPNRPRSRVSFTAADPSTGQATSYLIDAVSTTPGFFQAMRLPLIKGRWLTTADAGGPPVMLVSARTARRFFGDRDPIGHSLPLGGTTPGGQRANVAIVGVVGDVKYSGIEAAADGAIYRPFAQATTPSVFAIVRGAGHPAALVATLRHELTLVDPGLVIYDAGTADGAVADAVAEPRFRTTALASLAALGLALAAIGLYGVVAYSVSQRTVEIGIRIALGATRRDVTAMVITHGLRLAAAGVALGLAASAALVRTLSALLYGVAPIDAWSFGAAAGVLVAVTLVASYLPARRATRVDPMVALRAL